MAGVIILVIETLSGYQHRERFELTCRTDTMQAIGSYGGLVCIIAEYCLCIGCSERIEGVRLFMLD